MKIQLGDTLRISPQYTSRRWQKLDLNNPEDWSKAAEIVRDRLEGRFLRFASEWLRVRDSGFVVLAIDCLLAETIQQFRDGIIRDEGIGKSKELITKFLEGRQFQPDFDSTARTAFFEDIRCGLLHQAEARKMWLIRRRQPGMLGAVGGGKGYIIDVERFHAALKDSLDEYVQLISQPDSSQLRSSLWRKMNDICNVREARGAVYEPEPPCPNQ